jgi:general secretion pathway protein J
MMPRRQHMAGFTLLELLIALALLGFILVLLFGGLRLGMRSWDAAQRQIDTMNSVRSIEGLLRSEFSTAFPYPWTGAYPPRLAFLGESKKISFVAPLPSRIESGGLSVISVELEQATGGMRLVWRHTPLTSRMRDFSALAQAPEMVLAGSELGGVEDIAISYYGRSGNAAEPAWLGRWENEPRLPQLIRIQVKLSNGEPWPDFVVAPVLSSGVPR